jgi:hypothetical protein
MKMGLALEGQPGAAPLTKTGIHGFGQVWHASSCTIRLYRIIENLSFGSREAVVSSGAHKSRGSHAQ